MNPYSIKERCKLKVFEYGEFDCFTFTNDILHAWLGYSLLCPVYPIKTKSNYKKVLELTRCKNYLEFLRWFTMTNNFYKVFDNSRKEFDFCILKIGRKYIAGVIINGSACSTTSEGLAENLNDYIFEVFRKD